MKQLSFLGRAVQGTPPPTMPERHRMLLSYNVGLMLIIVILLLTSCTNLFEGNPNTSTTASQLRGAGLDLSSYEGTHYTGQITSAAHGTYQADLMITNTGSTRGTLIQKTNTLQYLVTGGKTFIQANQAFWQQDGADAKKATLYSKRWVKVPPTEFGIDVEQILAPAKLGIQLQRTANSQSSASAPVSKINGVSVSRFMTPQAVVYITTSKPYRVVRIESGKIPPATPTRPPTSQKSHVGSAIVGAKFLDVFSSSDASNPGASSSGSGFQMGVNKMPDIDTEKLFDTLKTNIEELSQAVDSEVNFSINGKVVLAPCGLNSCTANVTISNQISTNNPNVKADQPIPTEVSIHMTLDGAPIRDCNEEVSMQPNGTTQVSCVATYVVPADGRMHLVQALAQALARAVVSADIKKMANDLANQQLESNMRGRGLLPADWTPEEADAQFNKWTSQGMSQQDITDLTNRLMDLRLRPGYTQLSRKQISEFLFKDHAEDVPDIWKKYQQVQGKNIENVDQILRDMASGLPNYYTGSRYQLDWLEAHADQVKEVEAIGPDGKKAADFVLNDPKKTVVDVKSYKWTGAPFLDAVSGADIAAQIVRYEEIYKSSPIKYYFDRSGGTVPTSIQNMLEGEGVSQDIAKQYVAKKLDKPLSQLTSDQIKQGQQEIEQAIKDAKAQGLTWQYWPEKR